MIRVLKNEAGLPWTAYLGVLGLAGETAWVGYKAHAQPKKVRIFFFGSGCLTHHSLSGRDDLRLYRCWNRWQVRSCRPLVNPPS